MVCISWTRDWLDLDRAILKQRPYKKLEPKLIGLKETSRREDETSIFICVVGDGSDLRAALAQTVRQLPNGAEVSAIEVGVAECYHEVRASKSGFMHKRGCHGCYGTWTPCSEEEAVEWLLPGFEAANKNAQIEPASITIRKWKFSSFVMPVL